MVYSFWICTYLILFVIPSSYFSRIITDYFDEQTERFVHVGRNIFGPK